MSGGGSPSVPAETAALMKAAASGAYAGLYQPLVARICAEEAPKYKTDRERLKAVKTRLHQLYGAYAGHTASKKLAARVDTQPESLLSLHASTRERLPYVAAFYAFIQAAAGSEADRIESVLDLGCGYNPFTIPWMPWREQLTAYYAYDIDRPTTELLNRYLMALGLPPGAAEADLAVETPAARADLALLCKLLPVLEAQYKGRGYTLLDALHTRLAVVTFPLKSLGGREKGMRSHYKGLFETYLKQPGHPYQVADQGEIGGELVYVLYRSV